MGKRSRRHMHWPGKNKLGCMWSWISMFDFGHSRGNQKLLSDKRHKDTYVSDSGVPKNKIKMLKDVKEIAQRTEGGIVSKERMTGANKLSVKKLIEEELVTGSTKKRNKISLSESERGGLIKRNQKKVSVPSKPSSGIAFPDTTIDKNYDTSESDLHIEAIMQEIFSHIQQKSISWSMHNQLGEPLQSEQKFSLLEERISEATKAIMHQKFLNGEHLTEAQKDQYYNKYMDTLEMLDTNKEFFLKLSEDPNSSLMKKSKKMPGDSSIQKPNINMRLPEQQGSDLQYALFRKKLNSRKGDEPNNKSRHSEPSNKIVILKPERTELDSSATAGGPIVRGNSVSQFSLSEIRKRLKLAMLKDRRGTSGDIARMSPYKNQQLRISDKIVGKDNLGMYSPSRNHFYVEKVPRPSSANKLAEKAMNKSGVSTKQRVSSIYTEAKRHLSELLNNGDEEEGHSSRHTPKTLEKLLSVPESGISPCRFPGRDSLNYHITGGKLSTYAEAQPCNKKSQEIRSVNHVGLDDLWSPSSATDLCPSDGNYANLPVACHPNCNMGSDPLIKDNELAITISFQTDDLTSQDGMKGIETTDSLPQLVDRPSVFICKSTTGLITSSDDQNICTEEINDIKACSEYDEQDTREEFIASFPSPLAHPFFEVINIDTDDLSSPVDKSERPSPVSVLEHVFSEDEVSPAGIKSHLGSIESRRLRPIRIQFDEDELSTTAHDAYIQGCVDNREMVFKYVEAVLSSAELCWDELYMKSFLSSQLLKESLFDEVEELFSQLPYDDRRLLFDCVNEILNRMSQRYFGGCPLLSFLRLNVRPAPKPQNAIQEVWEGVQWHLLPPPHPQSLEQIVKKDLERDAAWMDLRLDVEGLSGEMETTILQELMEDAVLSCIERYW